MPRDNSPSFKRPEPYEVSTINSSLGMVYAHHPPKDTNTHWSWRWIRTINGKTVRISLGRIPRSKIREALLEHIPYDEIHNRLDLSDIDTIGDLLRAWFGEMERRNLSPFTKKNILSDCKRLIKQIDLLRLSHLKPTISKQLYRTWKGKFADTTIHKNIQTLKHALRWGVENELALACNIEKITNPKGKPIHQNRHIPTETEVQSVLENLTGDIQLAIQIVAKTGCRLGELQKASWKNLRTENGVYFLDVDGKCNERSIVISEQTYTLIHSHKENQSDEMPIIQEKINSTQLRKELRKVGLPEFTFQDLRRFRANQLERSDIPDLIYEMQMGHSRSTARKHYLLYPLWEIKNIFLLNQLL